MTPVKRDWPAIRRHLSPEAIARFWAKVEKADGCWLWRGVRNRFGYGQFSVRGVRGPIAAHRIAYGLTHCGIPRGLNVLHSCDNPPCCNPAHLRAGTHAENIREAMVKGRHAAVRRKEQTHCKRGHPLSGDNLIRRIENDRVSRACRACLNAKQAENNRRKAERLRDQRAARWRKAVAAYVPPTRDELIAMIGERRALVLSQACALYGEPLRSLADIGLSLGITRERARQLCARALQLVGAPPLHGKYMQSAEWRKMERLAKAA